MCRGEGTLRNRELGVLAAGAEKGFGCDTDVPGDLAEEDRRQIPARVERNGRLAPVLVAVLAMGAALAEERETEALEKPLDLPWLEHGKRDHRYAT